MRSFRAPLFIAGLLLIGAAFQWPPKIWPPTDLPAPIRSPDDPALIQAVVPVMRAGTVPGETEERAWLVDALPAEFYQDLVDPATHARCSALKAGESCVISLGRCMSLSYTQDGNVVTFHPEDCQRELKPRLVPTP